MAPETPLRRTRRSFDDDFKAQAVRLVLDELATLRKENRELRMERDILKNHRARRVRAVNYSCRRIDSPFL